MMPLPNYEIKKVIGSGSFGFVFEAYDHTNQKQVALKRIEQVGNQLSREYEILFDIKDCDNVVQILDFYYSKTDTGKLIQNIIFEYLEDNLENILGNYAKSRQIFTEDQVQSYIYQILKGLQYVHSKGIAHRDLQPQNVLINKDEQIQICDFGSSKHLDLQGKNTPYIVSRYYRAPQLILCVTNYTTAIDIWAVGCIFSELITREPLFQGKSEGDQLFAIFKVLGSPSERQIKEYSAKVPFDPQLFRQFQNYTPVDLRAKYYYIKDIENLMDLLGKMFQYLPEERITAKEALEHPFFNNVKLPNQNTTTNQV